MVGKVAMNLIHINLADGVTFYNYLLVLTKNEKNTYSLYCIDMYSGFGTV